MNLLRKRPVAIVISACIVLFSAVSMIARSPQGTEVTSPPPAHTEAVREEEPLTPTPPPPPDAVPLGTVSISEQVLFEEQGVRLTARTIEESWSGIDITVLIENDSDVPVTVQARNVSVNGFMFEDIAFSSSVTAGNRANDNITFLSSGFERSGIETMGTIELSFLVFHSDSWNDIFQTEPVVIETSAAGQVMQAMPATIQTIFEQDGVSVAFMGVEESWLGTDVVLFIMNDTDEVITVQTRDEAVNGHMVFGIMSATVMPGKVAVDTIGFGSWELERDNITEIETVEFRLNISAGDSWSNAITTDIIQLVP